MAPLSVRLTLLTALEHTLKRLTSSGLQLFNDPPLTLETPACIRAEFLRDRPHDLGALHSNAPQGDRAVDQGVAAGEGEEVVDVRVRTTH